MGQWHEANRENKKMWAENFHTNWEVKKYILKYEIKISLISVILESMKWFMSGSKGK
jgi:hypothetical protein